MSRALIVSKVWSASNTLRDDGVGKPTSSARGRCRITVAPLSRWLA